jgi:predicted dehydrogenase
VIDVAIIGAGLMGRWHAHSATRAGGRVKGIFDVDPARARALAAKYLSARVLDAWDPMGVASVARVAHVCTPLDTHEGLIGGLLSAGVSVLAEKPLTPDASSTARLLDLAASRGVQLWPVHQMPFQDGVKRLRSELESLGRLLHIEFTTCTAGAAAGGDEDQDRLIADVLPHPFSLLCALGAGPIASLSWTLLHPQPGELRAVSVSGRTAVSLTISTHGRPTSNKLRVIGERGTFDADLFHGFAVLSRGRVSRSGKVLQPFADAADTIARAGANLATRAINQEPAYPGLTALVAAFYGAVRGTGESLITRDEILDIAEARDEFEKSLRSAL